MQARVSLQRLLCNIPQQAMNRIDALQLYHHEKRLYNGVTMWRGPGEVEARHAPVSVVEAQPREVVAVDVQQHPVLLPLPCHALRRP